jgi:hypothetical protein
VSIFRRIEVFIYLGPGAKSKIKKQMLMKELEDKKKYLMRVIYLENDIVKEKKRHRRLLKKVESC